MSVAALFVLHALDSFVFAFLSQLVVLFFVSLCLLFSFVYDEHSCSDCFREEKGVKEILPKI
jgi:hypothetical protein